MTTHPHARILAHALGIEHQRDRRKPNEYRNHYVCAPDKPELVELERDGLVERRQSGIPMAGNVVFVVTEAGKVIARDFWRARRLPRAKRVYARFLSCRDADPDLTFCEFLTSADYADIRRDA